MSKKFIKIHTCISASLGCICVAAFLIWGVAYSFMPPDLWIWLVAGGIFLLPCIIRAIAAKLHSRITLLRPIGIILMALLAAMIVFFLVIECFIAANMRSSYNADLDCIIVLGARVNGTVPSKSLMLRIETAYGYLASHGNCVAILSGGRGDGEEISEAECMKRELVSRGIDENRLVLEDRSTSTAENIRFSNEARPLRGSSVGIVSNGFHIFRAKLIAKSAGINAVGIASPSDNFIVPHYMAREFITTVADILRGNIKLSQIFK